MTVYVAGISDWLTDQSNDTLERIAAGTVRAMNWMMLKALDFANGGSTINLGAQWLQDVLTTMRYLTLPIVGLLFILQVVTAILSRTPGALWRAVWGSVLGVLLGAMSAFLVASLLFVVDEFSHYVLGDGQIQAELAMEKAFSMDGAIDSTGWLIVTVIAGLALIAFTMVIVVLFLRKAIIIGTVAFGPFAAAGLASGHTKSWIVKWAEVVFALAISKFVISVILTLGFSAISSSVTGDTSDALVGGVWVFLAAFAPLSVMKFVSFAGDRISQAHQIGSGSLQNVGRASGMAMGAAGAVGGAAGYALGKLGGHSGGNGGEQSPTSPSGAVGSKPGGGPAQAAESSSPAGTLAGLSKAQSNSQGRGDVVDMEPYRRQPATPGPPVALTKPATEGPAVGSTGQAPARPSVPAPQAVSDLPQPPGPAAPPPSPAVSLPKPEEESA